MCVQKRILIQVHSIDEAETLSASLSDRTWTLVYADGQSFLVTVGEVCYSEAVRRAYIWSQDQRVYWLRDDTTVILQ